jgi:hypothetical protein
MPVAPGLYWKTRLSHAFDAALKFVEVLERQDAPSPLD